MTEPYDYREVSLWFLNDETLYGLARSANSGTELYELCNDLGLLESFPSMSQGTQLTSGYVSYSWRCVHNVE